MCGIAGIVNYAHPPCGDALGAMLDLIVHRGPDDEGRYTQGPFAIGMRRLSIIDVKGGRQPIGNEDGTVFVVLNGELYNYLELRADLQSRGHVFRTNTDTEVAVHLYEEYGDDFPQRLNGMFALAIWDTRRQRVLLARDHLGIKPLYWHLAKGQLTFASELKCLLAAGVPAELDRSAIASYLHLGYIPRADAPFKDVHKLQPGCRFVFGAREPAIEVRYWSLADAFAQQRRATADEVGEEVRALLTDAIRLQLRSDVALGAFLSGGIDSSSVTAIAAEQLSGLNTFGVGFEGHYFDETAFARSVAAHCGTRHHEQRIDPAQLIEHLDLLAWHIDEPNSDPALLPSYLICRYARQHVKVALSGNGGDEVFGGYPRHWDVPATATRADRLRTALPSPLRRALRTMMGVRGEGRLRRLLTDNDLIGLSYWVEHARPKVAREVTPWAATSFSALDWIETIVAEVPDADWVNRRLYYDSTTYMPDQILNMNDRASMAVSLELRVPLLDVRLVEFMASVSGTAKIEGGAPGKKILKNAMRGKLPDEIFTRRKLGFGMPIVRWIESGPIRTVLDQLPTGHAARAGLLEGAALRPWLDRPDELKNNWQYFWNLIMLELWLGQIGKPRPQLM